MKRSVILALACGAALATAPAALAAPVSTGHSQWAWGNPSPQGQSLSAVTFSGTSGYAVGAFGTVLSSTDSGASWTGLPSGTTDDLDLVQELSPSAVVAAGGCAAIESTNAGESFTTLPLGLQPSGAVCIDPVAGLAFSDPDHGYIALRDGTLDYTADGGATLQAKTPIPAGSAAVTGLAFSSPTTGLAVTTGGLIEQTTDGGNSWTQVEAVPRPLAGVTFVSPTLAYAVGAAGELLESTDGGAAWTSLPLTITGGGTAPNLTSISCAGAENCLLTTQGGAELVRTTDGGMTGSVVTASGDALSGVAFAAGSTVVGVGQLGATAISADGGQTFAPSTSGSLAGEVPAGPLTAGLAAGSAYLPEPDGVAATTDAGESWTLERVPGGQSISSVAFTSAMDGFALDSSGLLHRTTDGGVSWSTFAQGHSARSVLVAPAARTLLLAGPHGVFVSHDDGVVFRRVDGRLAGAARGHQGALLSTLALNTAFAAHGTVVAYDASRATSIIVSRDGGRVWRAVPAPPHPRGANIDVTAVSASRLWVTLDGALWTTSNGGRQWRALPAFGRLQAALRVGDDAAQVSFSSPRDGVALLTGTAGGLFSDPTLSQISAERTVNGGATWTPELIAGNEVDTAQALLATPRGDIAVLDTTGHAASLTSDPLGLFTTTGTTAPARRLSLRAAFSPRRITRRALARDGHRVLLSGRVTPVLSTTAAVAVSYRVNGGWTVRAVRVASNGAFRISLPHVATAAEAIVQAVGTSAVAGAGTPVVHLTVRR